MLGRYQYAEALRRGVDLCQRVSVVNDRALWIERATGTNFPDAVQVVDWTHASERLWDVGKAVFGEGTTGTARWVDRQRDGLWDGPVAAVIADLEKLDLPRASYPAEVRQAPGYFRHNQARMGYPTYRRDGYPIGSGTVESGEPPRPPSPASPGPRLGPRRCHRHARRPRRIAQRPLPVGLALSRSRAHLMSPTILRYTPNSRTRSAVAEPLRGRSTCR
jgi:hypothetical protein